MVVRRSAATASVRNLVLDAESNASPTSAREVFSGCLRSFARLLLRGQVLLRGKVRGQSISATGGFALFVLLQFLYDPFAAAPYVADVAPTIVRPSEDVKTTQQLLKKLGLYSGPISGLRDSATVAAVEKFQNKEGLPSDGYVTPETIRRLQLKSPTGESVIADVDSSGMITFQDGWDEAHVISVKLPQLSKVRGFPKGNEIRFYRDAIPDLVAAFGAIEQSGLLADIQSWDGAFVPRTVRGLPNRGSAHAFGMAFDINAQGDGDLTRLVPIFERHGFKWGGKFDPGHFEWIPPAKRPK